MAWKVLGVGLTVGGLLLLAVGMQPESDDRELAALGPLRSRAASALQLVIVAGQVQQILPVSGKSESDGVAETRSGGGNGCVSRFPHSFGMIVPREDRTLNQSRWRSCSAL